jgi:hypothetical protein
VVRTGSHGGPLFRAEAEREGSPPASASSRVRGRAATLRCWLRVVSQRTGGATGESESTDRGGAPRRSTSPT